MIAKCFVALAVLALTGCENEAKRREPLPITLQLDKGEPVTLHIPRGYIETPEHPDKLEGPVPNAILRIAAKDFSEPGVLVPESDLRMLIEPIASAADAGKARQAAALRRSKAAEDALRKSTELSKPGLIVYAFPNGKENAEAYYFTSASGDVFVECWKSVCKAFKTWNKRVHLRFDYQPVRGSDVQAVDAAVDRTLQAFAAETSASR